MKRYSMRKVKFDRVEERMKESDLRGARETGIIIGSAVPPFTGRVILERIA